MGKETAKTLNSKMLEGLIAAASRQEQQTRNSQFAWWQKVRQKISKTVTFAFFGLLPQDDQVQQDDLIGAKFGCGKNGWGMGKIRRKTWWDPMG